MALPQNQPEVGFQEIRIFGVQRRNGERHKRSWIVRWSIDRHQHSRSFATRALAERFRTSLLLAQRLGEPFDRANGLPTTWQPSDDERADRWARRWLAEQWAEWAPRTRVSAVESLSRLMPLLVRSGAPTPPPGFRKQLLAYLDPTGDECPEVDRYFDRWGLALCELNRELLADVDRRLGLDDGKRLLSPSTASRRRKVSRACIRRAVELGVIAEDPWPPAPRGRSSRKAVRAVNGRDRLRNLPDPTSMARVIEAMRNHQPASCRIQIMTAVAYYARPPPIGGGDASRFGP